MRSLIRYLREDGPKPGWIDAVRQSFNAKGRGGHTQLLSAIAHSSGSSALPLAYWRPQSVDSATHYFRTQCLNPPS